jgi:type I restriction enzyme S subunit
MSSASIEEATEFVLDGTHGSPVRTETGIPVLSAQNVKDGALDYGTDRYTTAGEYEAFKKRLPLELGDVLLTIVGTIGRAAVLEDVRPLVFQRSVAVIRPRKDLLSPRFLYHVSQSETFQAQLARASNQSSQAGVYLGKLKKLRIPLPPLPEQRRIAEILDKADALRAKRRAALAQLDTLTQFIFLDMFGDPATNPKGWAVEHFGQVCETRLGKMLDQKKQTGKHRRQYLRNANVQWFQFDLTSLLEMDFDESDRKELRLESGDLLICEGGEPGRAAVWRGQLEECYFQKALHRARPDRHLANAEYLCWLLWFLAQRGTLSGVTSATIAHLTGEKLAVLPTMLPPIPLQQEFAKRLARVQGVAHRHVSAAREMDALFTSLQYRAFRGEL